MPVAAFCDIVEWIAGAASWFVGNLGAPILTGVVAGLAVPLVLRWESTGQEIRKHDREIAELNDELRRFLSDLSREVEQVFRRVRVERELKVLLEEYDDDDPILSRRHRTRWVREASDAMFDALWRYRDEGLRKCSRYIAVVESEEGRHERRRRRRQDFPSLRLSDESRKGVASWRRRKTPFREDDLLVDEDLTAREPRLFALETDEGLTWGSARRSILGHDK